jgi:hypothetical protein
MQQQQPGVLLQSVLAVVLLMQHLPTQLLRT